MEPQDNKQLALHKAISAHELAAAALADLMSDTSDAMYAAMLDRINANLTELQAASAISNPEDRV